MFDFKNIPIPKYIEQKNLEIAKSGMVHLEEKLKTIGSATLTKIGMEAIGGKYDTAKNIGFDVAVKTSNDALRIYMPEILALTVGSCLIGCVIGYQVSDKKLLKQLTK